jgi:C1A family cysteine protease
MHSYGRIKDKDDSRDYLYVRGRLMKVHPDSVDLRSNTSPVRDQGNLGSCTGFANATGMREFLQLAAGQSLSVMSPLFLYYEERVLEGSVSQDVGAENRDGMKVLQKMGCATESDWPYNISKFAKSPSATSVKNALNYTVASYHRLNTLADAQDCLANGSGFVMGFDVYESFESPETEATGRMSMPQPGEQLLGGHAVFVCGYKLDPAWPGGGYLIVKNSWGTSWGDKGFFYMPFQYVTKYANTMDMWVAVGNKPVPPTPTPTPVPSWLADCVAMLKKLITWLETFLGK